MTNEELLKIAHTRELTDERVRVAAAYWLDASPHERSEADGIILARYARHAMDQLSEQEKTIDLLRQALIALGQKLGAAQIIINGALKEGEKNGIHGL